MKQLFFLIAILIFSFAAIHSAGAEGASLLLSPGSESFSVGEIFSVKIKIDTAGIPINTAQAVIYFSVDKLEAVSLSKDDSVFSFWPEEPDETLAMEKPPGIVVGEGVGNKPERDVCPLEETLHKQSGLVDGLLHCP